MSDFDFSNVEGLAPKAGKTIEYPLDDVQGTPTLKLAHAGKDNKPYFNAALKSTKRLERLMSSNNPDVKSKALDEALQSDRELYPQFVIKGWSNVTDAGGKDVKFSKDACVAFLNALPDYIFMRVRMAAQDDFLFGDGSEALAEEVGNG